MRAGQLLQTPEIDQYIQVFQYGETARYLIGVKNTGVEDLLGSLGDAKIIDPEVEVATALGLLRGILSVLGSQATETTLAAILAKLTADPATQTTLEEVVIALETVQNQIDTLQLPGNAASITPSDTTDLANVTKSIYVGGAGDIKVDLESTGTAVVFSAIPAGTILPVRVKRVYETDTTATSLVALY